MGVSQSPRLVGDADQYNVSIPVYLILTLLTCGIFNLYWNYLQMEACNDMVGRREFSFGLWLILSLVTCGIYHIYYQYKMGSIIVEIQKDRGLQREESLPVISLIVTIVGLSIVADIIHQSKINTIVSE
ncbi:MAG: DUF4234 domain-containing protein [Planctomycetota bacterium]